MKNTFLLKTKNAERLYAEYAKALPIIDFHNHLSVADLAANRPFESLTELWLAPDPYKHRLMRICGIPEHYITGDASPFEKFEKYCEIFPSLAGNPVYDWSRMELSSVFDMNTAICKENARYIYDAVGERLRGSDYTCRAILSRFGIAYQSPVASLLDDLSLFDGKRVAPSLRGDNLLSPTKELIAEIEQATAQTVTDTASYIAAVSVLLDRFAQKGCRFADHALDVGFLEGERETPARENLCRLGVEYAKRGWTLLLHLGAKRDTSPRLAALAGPAGGYAAVGSGVRIERLCGLLAEMESANGLPDTVLFPLNMSDQAPIAVLQGSFSQDGVASKVQLGPAWWWCDHALGIRNTLSCVASFGVVSRFIGMTTDSRSVLSFARHDYFRRLLCTWLDEQNIEGEWELSGEQLGDIIQKICYQNAKDKIDFQGGSVQ